MADVDEKGDRRQVESRVLESQPEAQSAIVAGAADVKAVQALNQKCSHRRCMINHSLLCA
jgi:hypothetical protein